LENRRRSERAGNNAKQQANEEQGWEIVSDNQKDFWDVDERFQKVLYSMFDELQIAEMGMTAFCVLCCIRRHVPYSGVSSFPSAQLISQMLGCSKPPVYDAIKKLAKLGWLTIEKEGRKNVYGLNEKFFGSREDDWGDQHEEIAVVPYGIKALQDSKTDRDFWKKTGKPPPGSVISIEKANIRVEINNFYEGSKQIKQEIVVKTDQEALDKIPPNTYRATAERMMRLAGERRAQEALNDLAAEAAHDKDGEEPPKENKG
tara:strand:- start:632 stop:1408 length:777 start_codon:yes stop_codon:yes gene_type:complete